MAVFQDAGVHHVCEGLSEQTYGSGLLTLVLWNNQISFQAMSDISQALVSSFFILHSATDEKG